MGKPAAIAAHAHSLTGKYLSGRLRIDVPAERVTFNSRRVVKLKGACGNNLKSIDVEFPVGLMTCITGVSGSGKSTLVNDTLFRIATRELNRTNINPAPYGTIKGLEQFDKVVDIDQGKNISEALEMTVEVEMHFLPDIYVMCDVCRGKRYNRNR